MKPTATAHRAMTDDERKLALAVREVCNLNKTVLRLASVASQQCASITHDEALTLCDLAIMKQRYLTPEMRLLARNMETRLRGGRGR